MGVTALVIHSKGSHIPTVHITDLMVCPVHRTLHVFYESCLTPARVHLCRRVHSEVFSKHLPRVLPGARRCVPGQGYRGRLRGLSFTRKTEAICLQSSPEGVSSLPPPHRRQMPPFLIPPGFRAWNDGPTAFFNLLSFPVPAASPPPIGPGSTPSKAAAVLGSLAEPLPESVQELVKGKARPRKNGPGGTRHAVGGLSP